MAKTGIKISFESKKQTPYFMIVKEYYDDNGVVEHAEVIYQEDDLDSDIEIDGNVVLKVTETGVELHGPTSVEPWI